MQMAPATPEMQEKLRKIRYCVIGTFIGAIGRFCTGDTPVNDLLCAIVGIFLLNDDPNVAPCYACLASSPLGQCSMGGHGLGCAMTYAFLAGMNAIFLMVKLFTDGPFVLVSFCSQAAGAFLGMKLNAMVSAMAPEMAMPLQGLGGGMGPGAPGAPGGPGGPGWGMGGMGGMGAPGMAPGGGAGGAGGAGGGAGGGAPETQPFQAFRGTGMRLGG